MRSIGELGATGQEYLRRDGTPRSGGSGPFFNIIPLLNDNTSSVEKDW
ncbi:MAG TPA: hypothetical protein PK765_04950 [bacterium]|nr:hypothetical protein [bacterium]